jgi:hypothetical protein
MAKGKKTTKKKQTTNNELQRITQKTKDRLTPTPHIPRVNLGAAEG